MLGEQPFIAIEIARLFLENDVEGAFLQNVSILGCFGGPSVFLNFLQRKIFPDWSAMSANDRFLIARGLCHSCWHNTPYLVKTVISRGGKIDFETVSLSNRNGLNLLHIFAQKIPLVQNRIQPREEFLDPGIAPDRLEEFKRQGNTSFLWRELLRECISAGADIHAVSNTGRSPFSTLLHVSNMCLPSNALDKLEWLIVDWLEDI
jgi:hypothetical protein